jgi:hypothetical protein
MSKAARRMAGSIAEVEAFIDRIYKMNRIAKLARPCWSYPVSPVNPVETLTVQLLPDYRVTPARFRQDLQDEQDYEESIS